MVFSNLALNFRGPWMISPEQAAVMLPVMKGIMKGYITEFEQADSEKLKIAEYNGQKNTASEKKINVVQLVGTMFKYDSCEGPGTRTIANELLAADRNSEVIGHIIVADSGGGSVDSVHEMANAIKNCTKPVVAFVDGMAASACIYAISYCDRIIAHNSTDRIGCIGTMIELSGYSKFHKDGDFIAARIYADQSEEKNLEYEQALSGNDKLIRENLLNPLAEQFISDMKANRPGAKDEQLKGRTYFAKDVIGSLIDEIGSFEDALKAVNDLANAKNNENIEQNNNPMYPTLENLSKMNGQVYDKDGSTTVQAVQLTEIEEALAEGAANAQRVATLNSEIAEKDQTIAQQSVRIQELENSLAAAIEKANSDEVSDVVPERAPEAKNTEKEAANFEEALDSCNDFLEKFKNI